MTITIDIKNYDGVVKGLKDCQKDLAKGARRTMLDMAKREVKTVARNEVTKVYNVKKGDVSAKFAGYDQTGSVTLAGVTIPFFTVKFEQDRSFTPTHFGMTPKARPGGLPWERLGKQRKPIEVIHSHLSIPQMIDNEKVQPHIEEEISRRLEKGLARYCK